MMTKADIAALFVAAGIIGAVLAIMTGQRWCDRRGGMGPGKALNLAAVRVVTVIGAFGGAVIAVVILLGFDAVALVSNTFRRFGR
jgi:hypothetical protein